MPSLLDAALAGGPVDFSEIDVPALRALFGELEALRSRIDVVQIELGVAIIARGTDKKLVARDLKLAKAPNARQRVEAMVALPSLPAARAAFADGKIGVAHLVPLARVQAKFPEAFAEVEALYARKAAVHSPEGLRKQLVEFVKQHTPANPDPFDPELGVQLTQRHDGRFELSGVLDSISGETLQRALNNQKDLHWRADHPERNPERVEQPPYRQQLMRALVALCEGSSKKRTTLRSRYLVMVVIDHATLVHGLHERSIATTANGLPLSIEEIRKLACDADFLPVVVNGDSIPIDFGREQRWFSERQHLAALVMHPTCVMCDVPAENCAMHHIVPFPAGPTDIDNGVPLCASCHDLVHQHRLRIERTNGLVTSYRPDGSTYTRRAYNQFSGSRELKLSA